MLQNSKIDEFAGVAAIMDASLLAVVSLPFFFLLLAFCAPAAPFHLLKCCCFFVVVPPLLVLKGTYHNWKYIFPRGLNQMEAPQDSLQRSSRRFLLGGSQPSGSFAL